MPDDHAATTANGQGQGQDHVLPPAARDLLNRVTLVVASNRGPVEFQAEPDGSFSIKRGSGGVVTAISAISRYTEAIWVASAMTEGDRLRAEAAEAAGERVIAPEDTDFRLRFVVSDPEAYDRYYNQISNPLLWFLQHYLWDTPRSPDIDFATWDAWHNGYVTVNRQFAEEILAAVQGRKQPPLILLQDYHLYLVPGFLREARPDMTLQHFVHIPWPDPDYWHLLPSEMRTAICRSMLANDVIGFQTPRHARSFIYTCEANLEDIDIDYRRREIHYQGRVTRVRPYPISIDTEAVRTVAASADARQHEEHLRRFLNERTIVRVDRAEPSKNIVRGFQAYDRFLEQHPEFLGRVNFLALLFGLSRLEVAEYIDYLDDINTVVGRINTKYANAVEREGVAWQPIHLFIGDDYPRALAAMKHFDAFLVNAIFDGMNLVAKEAALLNQRNGVLILSEGAGAYQQLGPYAVTVSPTDIESTAEAIYRALMMPEPERARRARELRDLVVEQDILTWIYTQMEDLAEIAGDALLRRT